MESMILTAPSSFHRRDAARFLAPHARQPPWPDATFAYRGATMSPHTRHRLFHALPTEPGYGSRGSRLAESIASNALPGSRLLVDPCFLAPHGMQHPLPWRKTCSRMLTSFPHSRWRAFHLAVVMPGYSSKGAYPKPANSILADSGVILATLCPFRFRCVHGMGRPLHRVAPCLRSTG